MHHDHVALSNTGDWELVHDAQDIRGWPVYDGAGTHLGDVDTMIVDTNKRRVDEIVLEDGARFAAADLRIGEDRVYVGEVVGADADAVVTVYDDHGEVVERERVDFDESLYTAHNDTFESHHGTAYAATGRDYASVEPAYRYGFERAYHDDFRTRAYLDAEDDLRAGYADRDFDADRDAIRYGYSTAQRAQ